MYEKECKRWESMRSVSKAEKVWESVPKDEKVCQKLRKCANSWESTRKCAEPWESLRKYAKMQLLMLFFCSTNTLFFSLAVQKSVAIF